MSEEQRPDISFIAAYDQQAEILKYHAIPIASYYKALIANGVPDELACDIVRDMQWLTWCKANWPDDPPMGRM